MSLLKKEKPIDFMLSGNILQVLDFSAEAGILKEFRGCEYLTLFPICYR